MEDENLNSGGEGGDSSGGNAPTVEELTSQLETLRTESATQLEALRSEHLMQLEAVRTEGATQLETLRTESAAQVEALQASNTAQVAAVTASFRDLARTLPAIVPELVQGDTVEAVQASVATAREAYNRIAEGVTASLKPNGQQPGAGGGARDTGGGEGGEAEPLGSKGFKLIYQGIVNGKSGGLRR